MKKIMFMMMLLAAWQPAPLWAAEACAVDVQVNGLVCDFCARALEKTFGRRDEVQDITVDLDSGNVHIVMKEGKTLDDAILRQLITDSGYDVQSISKGC